MNRPQFPLACLSKSGIDYKATGSTIIGTTENGTERFYPLFVIVKVSAASSLTVAGSVSIGTNSSSYNNLLAITAMTGLTALNTVLQTTISTTAVSSVAANTGIYVNVTTGAIATSSSFDIYVFGFYS